RDRTVDAAVAVSRAMGGPASLITAGTGMHGG
ncbi:MAG: hypothetical protein JWR24_153, partial [Actinoallomurus sp.]|nr:hypothetical protein [Actinoallomurus sp.]